MGNVYRTGVTVGTGTPLTPVPAPPQQQPIDFAALDRVVELLENALQTLEEEGK